MSTILMSRGRWYRAAALIATAALPLVNAQDAVSPAEASFESRVQPIVFKNCQGCHTLGGHAGGLQLDSYDHLMKGGSRGATIVPGDPEASLLIKAVRRTDPEVQMPPSRTLGDSDIAILAQWIKDAASLSNEKPKAVSVSQAEPAKAAPVPAPVAAAPAKAAEPAPPATAAPAVAVAANITPEQEKFFETRIRPLLTKNCYACHTTAASGGLRLDSQESLLKGGKDGAVVVPGHPESSLLVSAIHYSPKLKMPPAGPLSADEVATLEKWIGDGAPWPKTNPVSSAMVTPEKRNFWSFHAPARPAVPAGTAWAYNDIDRFVMAKLTEKHLTPVGDADKRTLIRRVTYDLTGLPPAPSEVDAFLSDKTPAAYEHVIDRLLASKAYGERWGRMWLDVVRYADTSGNDGDYPVPQVSRYRDYVIQAFNDDKPYDRFIREQISGDLLPSQSEPEHWNNVVATGYLAGTVRAEGKPAYIADAVDNMGSAFLGVTIGCARCHDHKFDPIPTADYYAIYGILSSTRFPDPGNGALRYQRDFVYRDPKALERPDYKVFAGQLKPVADAIVAVRKLPGTYDDLVPQLEARSSHLIARMPDLGESAYAVTEDKPHNEKIQHYGDPKNLGDEVPRGFLQVLGGGPLPPDTKGSGRIQLADWLASKDNPLTARVMVNRIWQGHFAKGIVPTPNDFGTRGMPPSNQQLLDYLAWKFIDDGWSIKSLHKQILMSHAYRLSATDSAVNEKVDPDNALIWRHSRTRLDAEEIRDSLLADSGLLDRSPVKPHPFPPMAEWNYEDQQHFSPATGNYDTDHRTVYTMVQRDVKLPFFTIFDGPNPSASTDQRGISLTPLQALYFMNAPFPERCAANMASELFKSASADKDRIDQAFLTIYGRPVSQAEMEKSLGVLRNLADAYATHGTKDNPRERAFADLLKAMFGSNEFMFVD